MIKTLTARLRMDTKASQRLREIYVHSDQLHTGIREMNSKLKRGHGRRDHRNDTGLGDLLAKQGLMSELRALSVKREIGKELSEVMRFRKLTVQSTARQLNTTPVQITRMLDWDNADVKVDVLIRAAFVIGRELRISLTDGREN
jgi:hypothetical protein